jgi:hypothetical protein
LPHRNNLPKIQIFNWVNITNKLFTNSNKSSKSWR